MIQGIPVFVLKPMAACVAEDNNRTHQKTTINKERTDGPDSD
jgi:hypothetical protein